MSILEKLQKIRPEKIKKLNESQLKRLASDIREFLINSLSETGGHLGSNLGVVELSIALHYCYNSPVDKFLWDVGHQTYVHKILTGRARNFKTLRTLDGLSGFTNPKESEHDHFATGHASTALSSAMGLAIARDFKGENNSVVAIFGDGSLTGGLCYEALNNIGASGTNLLAILNDNQMSIAENVGAIHKNLNSLRVSNGYINTKMNIKKSLEFLPFGKKIARVTKKTKDNLRSFLLPGSFFEELGFTYIGPIDGHDIETLITVLNKIKKIKGPVLLHLKTQKGKGYELAENAPDNYHGVSSFSINFPIEGSKKETYSEILGKELINIAGRNEKVLAITAAMPDGTGLYRFKEAFPERFFDVGIAEQHAVLFSAGLAKEGFIPVVAIYSTFLQRAYDQLIHDVCLGNFHVVFSIDRAGITGEDGETHQGIFDISYLTHIPNLCVMAPKDKAEYIAMLNFAVNEMSTPVAIRYPKGTPNYFENETKIKYGKSETLIKGEKIAIVSFGHITKTAAEVSERLKQDGFKPTLINARFASPLDLEMLENLKNYEYVFTIEENVKEGGFGSLVSLKIKHSYIFALEKKYIKAGSRDELLKLSGLDTETIYNKIKEKIAFSPSLASLPKENKSSNIGIIKNKNDD
ncbi:MAG: 1-deoxy-D-xylulose-5-phosphate synthase [Defluviitaleaceae bacterium]|nr:1-deoxy-D-xylulose-5-phosphate synthase [Defluviitaleaceae bacterium]